MDVPRQNWHKRDLDKRTIGDKAADWVVGFMGSWKFIIIQTVFVVIWITINLLAVHLRWDPYPFILLNLLFSTQASYAAPIIMMSQNRQGDRDRVQAYADYETNLRAKEEIEQLQISMIRLESEKLDKIISLLESEKEKRKSRVKKKSPIE